MGNKSKMEFKARVDAALDRFIQKYPGAFFPKDSADTRPLAIGVFTILTGQNRDIGRKVIAEALARYTMKDRYLRALAVSESRFDLNGRPDGVVSEKHREFAIKLLAERQAAKVARAA